MPSVNPAILAWARETAGLTLEDAAKAIQLKAAKGQTGARRLEVLEQGESEPSRVQLRRMAEKYRRPLITFYLREPPAQGDRGEDFRRLPGQTAPHFDPQLDALIRSVRARQSVVRSLLEDEEAPPLSFVSSKAIGNGAGRVAESIADVIGFDLAEYRRQSGPGAAFSYLRDCLEGQGIFVLLIGDLGSHHSKIATAGFRGYAIADSIAPFIVINDNDAQAAWCFTALHEAAHLWLGQTGVSGTSHEARVERFCNDVAGRLLLPISEIQELNDLASQSFEQCLARISQFAADRNVSRRMVAYQLLHADVIDGEAYRQLAERFTDDWRKSKAKDPDKTREGSGPNYYVVRRHRLGPALLHLAQRSVDGGVLSPTKAAQMLGVKPVSVRALLNPKPA